MPTYEYECTQCGHNFEAFQKITDGYLDKCPVCGSKVRRLISSGVGIIFKPACPRASEGCSGCRQAS